MWVGIHKCMEAILRISLYNYLYSKLAKMLSFLLSQNCRRREQNRFCLEAGDWGVWKGRGQVAQAMYIHVSKCKNNKIKEQKIKYIRKQSKTTTEQTVGRKERWGQPAVAEQIKKWTTELNTTFPKEEVQMAKKHMKNAHHH
jgi:hypothetical protein